MKTIPGIADVRVDRSEGLEERTVNINTASLADLQKLPGIGAATATRIIEYRQKNGPFRSAEDLLKVDGIGDKVLDQNKGNIRVDRGGGAHPVERSFDLAPVGGVDSQDAAVHGIGSIAFQWSAYTHAIVGTGSELEFKAVDEITVLVLGEQVGDGEQAADGDDAQRPGGRRGLPQREPIHHDVRVDAVGQAERTEQEEHGHDTEQQHAGPCDHRAQACKNLRLAMPVL